MTDYFNKSQSMHFTFPIDGDCLNSRDGTEIAGGIKIKVYLSAPAERKIRINGVAARYEDGQYTAEAEITGYRSSLIAEDEKSGEECRINVFMLYGCEKKFRISSDDNLIFLYDINKNKDVYKSIFDNPYLQVYKKAHDRYGAKVHLNLFYEFDEKARSRFSDNPPYFSLAMMTDKFKDEFRANSDWLKLAFHARSEMPDRPYKTTPPEKIIKDCTDVNREIIRFAGRESLSNTTTVHWGEANEENVRALRGIGYRSLTGYFEYDKHSQPLVSYYAPRELIDHVGGRDFWYDRNEDMFFGRIDLVLNLRTAEENMERLRKIAADPHRGGFVSIMIHEQYFYSTYSHYLPDFEERVLGPCAYLYENGYSGSHISPVIQERDVCDYPLFGQ